MSERADQFTETNQDEGPRHAKAFELYWSFGQKRSYRRVARQMGVSTSTVKNWSRQEGWRKLIVEREVQQSRQLADNVEGGADPESTRNLKIVRVAILRIARAIAEGRVKASMGDLDRMVRLEERLTGIHGISPRRLQQAAAYLEDLQTMPMTQIKAEMRRIALDLEIIRPEELVEPIDETGSPSGRDHVIVDGPKRDSSANGEHDDRN